MNLLPEQEETLVNFQAVTDNWDTESSLSILKRNNWNLELATNEYMSGSPNSTHPSKYSSIYSETLSSSMLSPSMSLSQSQDSPSAPIAPTTIWGRLKSIFNEMWSESNSSRSKAAQDFLQKLVTINPRILSHFSAHVLKDVVQEAKNSRKMLFMYISSESVPISYTIEVLCNPRSLNLISTHYIAWAVERESAEGTTAEKLLRATSFPCLAIVSVENPSRPVVLSKIEGSFTASYVAEFLSAQFEPIRQADPRQQELENERRLRMMQDMELEAAEKILEERKKNEENKRNEERKIFELKDANRKAKIQAVGEEAEGDEAVLVSFRMVNGSKAERRFDKRRSIQVLYDYLEIQDIVGVEILFGFPAVILTDKNVSLEEAGLFPKALVIVRKIEDN